MKFTLNTKEQEIINNIKNKANKIANPFKGVKNAAVIGIRSYNINRVASKALKYSKKLKEYAEDNINIKREVSAPEDTV